jgi:hypothetical protein
MLRMWRGVVRPLVVMMMLAVMMMVRVMVDRLSI